MTVLVVAAHPDDEVLGCGGTIAKLAREGTDIYIAILGEGITSRCPHPRDAKPSDIKALRGHSRKAASLLGARKIYHHDFPDNRFDSVDLLDLVKIVEAHLAELNPHVIYTHCQADLNLDHMLTHRAVLTATRPLSHLPVREIYAFEIPSSTDWAFGQFEPGFRPNTFVDISETLATKLQAIQLYETEIEPFPHPRSPKAIQACAQRWGSISGLKAAEAFQLVRKIQS